MNNEEINLEEMLKGSDFLGETLEIIECDIKDYYRILNMFEKSISEIKSAYLYDVAYTKRGRELDEKKCFYELSYVIHKNEYFYKNIFKKNINNLLEKLNIKEEKKED